MRWVLLKLRRDISALPLSEGFSAGFQAGDSTILLLVILPTGCPGQLS